MSNRDRNKNNFNNGTIWIYGRHAAFAALSNPQRKILRVLATKNMFDEVKSYYGERVEMVDGKALENILPKDATHQGIAIQAAALPELDVEDVFQKDDGHRLAVILDQVTDPQNVGAIMRSAAAFNADAVIVTKDNSPRESTTLTKAASGAMEVVPLVKVTNLAAAMKYLKDCGFWCIGLDAHTDMKISDAKGYDKVAMVMGAEGAGLRRLTAETCDLLVKLPISDKVESLNVSNAAAIALYELAKK